MKYIVRTPNKSFKGKRHGVHFRNGEATGEFAKEVIAEFKNKGYDVEEIKEKKKAPTPQKPKK